MVANEEGVKVKLEKLPELNQIPCRNVMVKSFLSMYNAKKEALKTNVIKTGPDRPVRPVKPGTGQYTGPVCWGKYLHLRCLAYVVNLIVKSELNCMDNYVAFIRNAVKYIRSSPVRLQEFKACVKKEELDNKKVCVLDVQTRWNSTFIMLETAYELKLAFDSLAEEDNKYKGYFNGGEEYDDDVD
ncbi:zinc finger BED domain-containing protein 4 [Striga asiatica]|uniref:Zinc finger BED domain-containing protein 4 n=1 Tax=Striga asiatica TaxID=4170 RepID=A0A5A7PER7_STRAF|nr:zinc finger BED domain-containing protein 4 [Striga asiatica]